MPKDQNQIDDRKVFSAYLTESLVLEIDRVKSELSYADFASEFK